jgi:cytochrome c-type biogenesis protein
LAFGSNRERARAIEVAGLSLPLVFAAGAVSFVSPCVLPLVPGYVSTISGVSFEQLSERRQGINGKAACGSALFFVGFLGVFIALGASASVVGSFLIGERTWLNRIAGALIVLFGLSMLGIGWSGTLGGRWTSGVEAIARRRGGPVALGVGFAFCWTPCVGPVLASILALAGSSGSLRSGVLLLSVYGLGLAVPFLVVGFGFTQLFIALKRVQAHYRAIEAVGGLLLVAMGSLLLTGYLFLLNIYAQHLLAWLHLAWWTSV